MGYNEEMTWQEIWERAARIENAEECEEQDDGTEEVYIARKAPSARWWDKVLK